MAKHCLLIFGLSFLLQPLPGLFRTAETQLKTPAVLSLFEKGLVSTVGQNDELSLTFAPDGKTIFFVRRIPGGVFTIFTSDLQQGKWTNPRAAEFSGRFKDQGPFMSPDGRKLFFYSNRPIDGNQPRDNDDIWFVEKEKDKWSEPKNVGSPINTPRNERSVSVDNQGTLYFWIMEELPGGMGASDIYRSKLVNGKYTEPENLSPVINTAFYEANPVIAADGSYLLFTSDDRPDGLGRSDIYISYFKDGRWQESQNLGATINSSAFDFSPGISPDGRHLFLSSNRNMEGGDTLGKQKIYYISLESLKLDLSKSESARRSEEATSLPKEILEVTYLANEGYFVKAGTAKILIDSLYRNGVEGYETVPRHVLDIIETARPPFDDIDLVLATHSHADHFDPNSIKAHLEKNSSAVFVSTADAVAKVSSAANVNNLNSRLITGTPKEGESQHISHGGIDCWVLNLHHGRNRQIENLGFLLKINGQKILHVGDTEANFAEFGSYDLISEKIDVAFLPYWYFLNDDGKKVVRERVAAKRIVVMHLPPKTNEDGFIRRLGGWDAVLRKIKAEFPNAVIETDHWTRKFLPL